MTRLWLLAEDDDLDAAAVHRALRELGESVEVERVTDGEAALERLRGGAGRYSLALLDLNMPRLGGLEVLAGLAGAEGTAVVVLSTTAEESERAQCLKHGASGVFVKAVEYGGFLEVMRGILRIESLRGKP